MRGWQSAVRDESHRPEFVAGGRAGYAMSEFKKAAEKVGDLDGDWNEIEDQVLYQPSNWSILKEPLKQLPQVCPFRSPPLVFAYELRGNADCAYFLDLFHVSIGAIARKHPAVAGVPQPYPECDEQFRIYGVRDRPEDEVRRAAVRVCEEAL